MRLHRFYIEQKVGEQNEITIPSDELVHQIVNVFRLGKNDRVILFDNSGFEFVTQILSFSKKEITLSILEKVDKSPEVYGRPLVSLYLSLIKKSNFELALEKVTEVGVAEIHPVVSERSEAKNLNFDRLQKIVKEASEQCGRVTLPEVFHVTDLEVAVSQAVKQNDVCIVFHTGFDEAGGQAVGKAVLEAKAKVAVFVGPEGGWTDKEIEIFKKNNFQVRSLGQNVLRAETAAIVAVWAEVN
jgi:16S rRNA (uracil1498-N3)-methyltransferase